MKLALLSAATLAAALLAGAAYAQSTSPSDPNAPSQPTTQAPSQQAPSAGQQGSNASANTNVTVVTNGPVPDTPENRARFKPLSATGRATKPSGN